VKLVFFNDYKLGVLRDGNVIDCSALVSDINSDSPQDLISKLIESFGDYKGLLEKLADSSDGAPLSSVKLRSPLPKPRIVCMAVNYIDILASEPKPINGFNKSPNAVIGPNETIELPPYEASIFEHEAELGLVIGKATKNVRAENALQHIFGYVNFIDVSARDLGGNSFFWGKSWDTFAPIGPAIVTADEIDDPQNLQVKLWVNGKLRQDFTTSDMAHKIPRSLEWVSSIAALRAGDLIATGTNHAGLGPLQDGDEIEMEIEGLERLSGLKVKDQKHRSWPIETRLERMEREKANGK